MEQIASSGSAKAIWLDKEQLFKSLKAAAEEARQIFPAIKEIRLFGSLARKEATGFERYRYFHRHRKRGNQPGGKNKKIFLFFSERSKIALDVIASRPEELANYKEMIKNSLLLT